ncbi:MAG TPA: 4'-phosphopantetheinyl transferase superfamily protein [Myxococcales bacterium]|nr:4'-phosphopantetheinyl transferase superfamily protein [Myxococcales bacterium]
MHLADPVALAQPERVERYLAMLEPHEVEQYHRFLFDQHRQEFLVTRALVRTVLSAYVPRAPEAWRFVRTEHGRPLIAGAAEDPEAGWLTFNLSNTTGLVACAVVRDRELGVDVEWLDRHGQVLEVADRYFSEFELEELRSLPAERQRGRFFDYWTLKESYIKAHGKGLAMPLGAFSMVLGGEEIGLRVAPPIEDDEKSWQFFLTSPAPLHRLAVAVRRRSGPPVEVLLEWVEP